MPIQRIPLAQPIETRNGTLTKDSKTVNGYFETRDDKKEFIKRPGLSTRTTVAAGEAQGITYFNGYLYSVIDNTIYKTNPSTWTTTTVGTISGTLANVYFTQTLNNGWLFLHNRTNGYLINGNTGVFSQITNDKVVDTIIVLGGSGYTSGTTVTFSNPPSGVTATGTPIIESGVITGITITNPGSGYVVPPSITFTDSPGAGASATSVLSFFPSGPLVAGAVFLDSYVIVGTESGRVYSSGVNNPELWNPLDYITAEAEPDQSTGICKHLNYVMDFGQWSTEFFYDAANYPGSPLANAPAYRFEIGCAAGDSIVSFENVVLWIGISRTTGTSVYALDGTTPIKISSVYIDRILRRSNLSDVKAYVFRYNGHPFYVLTLHDINVTIVYDLAEKAWYQWTMWAIGDANSDNPGFYGEQYFRPSYYAGDEEGYYTLDDDNGKIYSFSSEVYNDAGAPIYYRSVTDIIDSGSTKRKFYARCEIVGDKISGIMNIRNSSNDYQSWTPYRGVDLYQERPQIYQLGTSRRRSWEFLCTDNVPLRLDAAEVDFEIGELENDGLNRNV